jgi:hypothetical protein
MKIQFTVEMDDLNAYDDADIIMGIFRKYLQPIKESERNFLNSGGQSMNAYRSRCLMLLKRRVANGQLTNVEIKEKELER